MNGVYGLTPRAIAEPAKDIAKTANAAAPAPATTGPIAAVNSTLVGGWATNRLLDAPWEALLLVRRMLASLTCEQGNSQGL